ncbi:MAG: sulfatase/phosphatase domain-containing protein, partial [Planctomycetota bacterium]
YDGGHRVPFFIHWPAGGLTGGRDVTRLTAHIDVLPTLANLCDVPLDGGPELDGSDLSPLLEDPDADWPDRALCVHSQRIEVPEKWRTAAVMTDRWRLVGESELYDMAADPGQTQNVAEQNPSVVARLSRVYDEWWNDLSPAFDEAMTNDLVTIDLGKEPTELCSHDWHQPSNRPVPWSQRAIRNDPQSTGWWAVNVSEPGAYRFTLRARPAAASRIGEGVPARATVAAITLASPGGAVTNEPPERPSDEERATFSDRLFPEDEAIEARAFDAEVDPRAEAVELTVSLNKTGPQKLWANFQSADGSVRGAYYVTVQQIRD